MIKNTFNSIVEIVEEINALDFFNDIGSKIILVDKTYDIEKEISTRILYDLVIEIHIEENRITLFDHSLDINFGNEFSLIWDKEIINRGLDFSSKKMNKMIIEDYKHLKFNVTNLANLKEIIVGLYTFQILIKYILRNGKIPTPTWNKNHPDYDNWKSYYTIKPITAGTIDAIVDEIIGIPTGIYTLYEIASFGNYEKELLDKFFKLEVNSKLIEMYQNQYGINEILSEYKAGKTFISVGTMRSDKIEEILK